MQDVYCLHHSYKLTSEGEYRAAHIVRLHRLWEVYLADYLGIGVERVHPRAEEMEHIITPELFLNRLYRFNHHGKENE